MATVPTAPRVTANQISPQRTDLTGITEFRGAGATAKAQTQFGQAVSGASDQLAKLGAQIQLGDEKRDLTQRELEIRKVFSDHETGAPAPMTPDGIPGQQGIAGYRADKKEDALRNAPARKKEVEDAINKILDREGSAGWVNAELRLRAQNRGQVFDSGYESYLMGERVAADKEVINAGIEQTTAELANILPSELNLDQLEQAGVSEIALAVTLKLKNDGITNQKSIDNAVKKELSFAHERRIKWLQSQGFNTYARDYFSKIEGQLTDQMSSTLNDITRVGAVGDQAFGMVNQYINLGVYDSRATMLAQARTDSKGNSELFDALKADVSDYWNSIDAAKKAEEDNVSGILNEAYAKDEKPNLTPEQKVIGERSGALAKFEKARSERWLTREPDPTVYSKVMEAKVDGTFHTLDLTTDEMLKGLGNKWEAISLDQVSVKRTRVSTVKKALVTESEIVAKAQDPAVMMKRTKPFLNGEGLGGSKKDVVIKRGNVQLAMQRMLVERVRAGQTEFSLEEHLAIAKLALTEIEVQSGFLWFTNNSYFAEALNNGNTSKIAKGLPDLIDNLDAIYPRINRANMKLLVENLTNRPTPVLPTPKNINILLAANRQTKYASGPMTLKQQIARQDINKNRTQPVASTLADTGDPTGAAPAIGGATTTAAVTPAVAPDVAAKAKASTVAVTKKLKVPTSVANAPAAKKLESSTAKLIAQKQKLDKDIAEGSKIARGSKEFQKELLDLLDGKPGVKTPEDIAEAVELLVKMKKIKNQAATLKAARALTGTIRENADAFAENYKASEIERLRVESFAQIVEQDIPDAKRRRFGAVGSASEALRAVRETKRLAEEAAGKIQMDMIREATGLIRDSIDEGGAMGIEETPVIGQGMEDSLPVADPTIPAEPQRIIDRLLSTVEQEMGDSLAEADPTSVITPEVKQRIVNRLLSVVGQVLLPFRVEADPTVLAETMGDSEAVADPTVLAETMGDSEAVADQTALAGPQRIIDRLGDRMLSDEATAASAKLTTGTGPEVVQLALKTIRQNEGGATTDFDGTKLGDLGMTEARHAELSKKAGRKLSNKEAVQAAFEQDYELLSARVDGFKTLTNAAKVAILDMTYATGNAYISDPKRFKKLKTALAAGDSYAALVQTLDTANAVGQSVKGIALRRARMFNRAVTTRPIAVIKAEANGRITYLDADSKIILSYKPKKGLHERSSPEVIEI